MSSNAVSIGRAALLVVDARRLLDAWLSVAALSFEAAAADPVVLDARIHSARHRPGQAAVAARMRELLGAVSRREREIPGRSASRTRIRSAPSRRSTAPSTTPCCALEETVGHELNFAGENALIVAGERRRAARTATPTPRPLANAIDGLRTALA